MSALRDANPFDDDQWPTPCRHASEPSPGRLRLQIPLPPGAAICDAFVDEHPDRVEVEVLACGRPGGAATVAWDVEIYLQTPLNGRPVIDLATGERRSIGPDPQQSSGR